MAANTNFNIRKYNPLSITSLQRNKGYMLPICGLFMFPSGCCLCHLVKSL
ncbi:MAG: hypothetical protein M5F18_00135 [Asgard group archaeon]|nr:hypothetical protein [Asgard group archaeon]